MHTFVPLVLLVLALVCLGIPVTAVVVVYRDELPTLWGHLRRAVAFDPRHPALHPHPGR